MRVEFTKNLLFFYRAIMNVETTKKLFFFRRAFMRVEITPPPKTILFFRRAYNYEDANYPKTMFFAWCTVVCRFNNRAQDEHELQNLSDTVLQRISCHILLGWYQRIICRHSITVILESNERIYGWLTVGGVSHSQWTTLTNEVQNSVCGRKDPASRATWENNIRIKRVGTAN